MKAKLTIILEFESWFDEGREPQTNDAWKAFFEAFFITEAQVIGTDDGEFTDMVLVNSVDVDCEIIT